MRETYRVVYFRLNQRKASSKCRREVRISTNITRTKVTVITCLIIAKWNVLPYYFLLLVFYLFKLEKVFVESHLQFLIAVIYTQLLEAILFKYFKSKDICRVWIFISLTEKRLRVLSTFYNRKEESE